MKEVACDDHDLRSGRNDAIDGATERIGGIGFPLIQAGRGLPVILAEAEMEVGEVSEFHGLKGK
jgi:hypothetical protein